MLGRNILTEPCRDHPLQQRRANESENDTTVNNGEWSVRSPDYPRGAPAVSEGLVSSNLITLRQKCGVAKECFTGTVVVGDGGPLSEIVNINSHHSVQGKPSTQRVGRAVGAVKHYDSEAATDATKCVKVEGSSQLHDDEDDSSTSVDVLDMQPGVTTVPLSTYKQVECERNRYMAMYKHQKSLYEEMAKRQEETYKELQEKIIEVVALTTRNEENKRLIRQLKSETTDNRLRMMAMQNRNLGETKFEKSSRERYEKLLREQEEKHKTLVEQQNVKISGLESLLGDVMTMKGENDRLDGSHLDALLKAAYSKNSTLFGDVLRQGKQIDALFQDKASLEQQLEKLRCDKRDLEAMWSDERYQIIDQMSRYAAQIAEQQQSILSLRKALRRATAPRGVGEWEDNIDDEEDYEEVDSRSSGSSSPSSDEGGDVRSKLHDGPHTRGGNDIPDFLMMEDEMFGSSPVKTNSSPQESVWTLT